jgi:hypothetical protein
LFQLRRNSLALGPGGFKVLLKMAGLHVPIPAQDGSGGGDSARINKAHLGAVQWICRRPHMPIWGVCHSHLQACRLQPLGRRSFCELGDESACFFQEWRRPDGGKRVDN